MDFETYQVRLDDWGMPKIERSPIPELEAVPDLNLGYAPLLDLPERGLTLARGRVEPGAEVPPHAADNHYLLLVVSGTGKLTLMRSDRDEADCELAYRPGTVVNFPPHARHGWVNDGDEPLIWFGIDLA